MAILSLTCTKLDQVVADQVLLAPTISHMLSSTLYSNDLIDGYTNLIDGFAPWYNLNKEKFLDSFFLKKKLWWGWYLRSDPGKLHHNWPYIAWPGKMLPIKRRARNRVFADQIQLPKVLKPQATQAHYVWICASEVIWSEYTRIISVLSDAK